MTIKISPIDWNPCYRIIPSMFPPINLFERVVDPEDLEAVYAIESLTNDRLREEVGDLSLVPAGDRIAGPGSSFVMAAFTHLNPVGSRFSDGTWGVYYAAASLNTAVKETVYHRELFMRATAEQPMHLDMRVLTARVCADMHDIRGSDMYCDPDPARYPASQRLAADLKRMSSNGIVYDSVRDSGGQNIAAFKPIVVSGCRQERHLEYIWDGEKISDVFEKHLLNTG
ncbi:MAG: RES family NAD+ phosphorylase [Alphaproteobacteria bacterium]